MKVCFSCGEEKEEDAFNKNKRKKDGLETLCRVCRSQVVKSPKAQEARKRYYDRTKEDAKVKRAVYTEKNRERLKQKRLEDRYKKHYNMTVQQYEEMRLAQNCRCFICNTHESENTHGKLFVDHDHTSGNVRKLLCNNCNIALGHIKDDRILLSKMDQYLKDHSQWPH